MWLRTLSGKQFEETFENAQWRKVWKMQPMWICIPTCMQFEDSFENAQRGKVKQMQPVWICIFSGSQFEDTFENAQWGIIWKMQAMWLCMLGSKCFAEAYEKTQWRKVNLCEGGAKGASEHVQSFVTFLAEGYPKSLCLYIWLYIIDKWGQNRMLIWVSK